MAYDPFCLDYQLAVGHTESPDNMPRLGQLADNIQWRKPRGVSVTSRYYGDFVDGLRFAACSFRI